MLPELVLWLTDIIGRLGYAGIALLMFLESSFFPFPSEIVIIPAGYLAFQGKMDFTTVIIMGIIGSLLGALFNYYLAVKLGRPLLIKYGRYLLLNEQKLDKVDTFFKTHGSITTFVGRLLPGIRQYISFPAGLTRMKLIKFSIYTSLGAGLWVAVLAYIGYLVGGNQEAIKEYTEYAAHWILLGVAVLIGIYVLRHKIKQRIKAD